MAGSDSQDALTPKWQQQHNSLPSQTPDNIVDSVKPVHLEQAVRFLQDESIRNAPIHLKVAFLESKGLENDEIQRLLGISKDMTTATQETAPKQEASSIALKGTAAAVSETQPPSPESSNCEVPPTTSAEGSSTPQGLLPIITYPEFLSQPTKPPLVTLRNVLYTLYGTTALATSIYGMSEYVVTPMRKRLNGARHELAEAAQENLHRLNEKLEQNVSTIPSSRESGDQGGPKAADAVEDSDSVTSDPTELFHRDFATQTTPGISRVASMDSLRVDANTSINEETSPINSHLNRLETITSCLHGFLEDENATKAIDDTVQVRLSEFRAYLDGLTYGSGSSYLNNPVFGIYSGDTRGVSVNPAGRGEDDAISNFKAEIRAVKGALLSARNFPSGRSTPVAGVGR
ncbi:Peroxisomal membrane anchor protein (Pex14p) conserved region domain containing protein [Elaphomyces granulatus]